MGFINAMAEIGALDQKEGIESYLKFPLEGGGRVIRVFLDVVDPQAEVLEVKGVAKVDLADLIKTAEMKRRYLYRDRVGANVSWGFTPLHKIGKPKASTDKNLEYFRGTKESWQQDKDAQLYKIKERVLVDYEKEGIFSPGSADRIMVDLSDKIVGITGQLDKAFSHIVLFGIEQVGQFLYPGDIPALLKYFSRKLDKSLDTGERGEQSICALCRRNSDSTSTLDKVFKFATFDKVHPLPGLDKNEQGKVFPVCGRCLEKVAAGREHVERTLTNSSVVPGLRLWVVPEAPGAATSTRFRSLLNNLENKLKGDTIQSLGDTQEDRYFQRLARDGQGLIFHFFFWERNNSQEMVHLMIEDVPPERLAQMERTWQSAMRIVMGDVNSGLNLDWTIKSIYTVLNVMAGKSNSDKVVVRDLALKIVGKMLSGQSLPIMTFKQFVTARVSRLVHENDSWEQIGKFMRYAQVWVEFMTMMNEGGAV